MVFFGAMLRFFLLAGLLVASTLGFAPAPIQWRGLPAKGFVLASKVPANRIFVPPQILTIREIGLGSMVPNTIPYFTAKPDQTIFWEAMGLCLEASGDKSGDVIGVNRCTGEPAQKWKLLPWGHGRNSQIQLKDTNKCIDVVGGGVLSGASVELQDCGNKATESWALEESISIPRHGPTLTAPLLMRDMVISFTGLVAIGLLSLGAWLWRWQQVVHIAALRHDDTLAMEQGGICLSSPLAVSKGLAPEIPNVDVLTRTTSFGGVQSTASVDCFEPGEHLSDDIPKSGTSRPMDLCKLHSVQSQQLQVVPAVMTVSVNGPAGGDDDPESEDRPSPVLAALPNVALAGVLGATVIHAPAFAGFVSQWQEIAAAGVTGNDFNAPLQFWAFFAAMHPLLQPGVWIGEVLHSSPGPQIGGVMPVSFVLLNAAVIGVIGASAEVRNAAGLALLAAFVNYVGLGLEGSLGLADYNLALDDGVRGCPTYEEVRQTTMDDYDPVKYQGRWYEHAFHDWTQFKEVYDTTLDVELSKDGSRWLDDFAVRGPSPESAPTSWEKSPVANGAHYFLSGKLAYPGAKPGVIQESGFGVTFPNYIVDVQKDDKGEYTESIQFQCLERGGKRIFEGINFLSRSPTMSDEAMKAMFERAGRAGIAPYGATPEQMQVVPHRSPDLPRNLDNNWQGLWRGLGVDKLLTLLEESTHSAFEDTVTRENAELSKYQNY